MITIKTTLALTALTVRQVKNEQVKVIVALPIPIPNGRSPQGSGGGLLGRGSGSAGGAFAAATGLGFAGFVFTLCQRDSPSRSVNRCPDGLAPSGRATRYRAPRCPWESVDNVARIGHIARGGLAT